MVSGIDPAIQRPRQNDEAQAGQAAHQMRNFQQRQGHKVLQQGQALGKSGRAAGQQQQRPGDEACAADRHRRHPAENLAHRIQALGKRGTAQLHQLSGNQQRRHRQRGQIVDCAVSQNGCQQIFLWHRRQGQQQHRFKHPEPGRHMADDACHHRQNVHAQKRGERHRRFCGQKPEKGRGGAPQVGGGQDQLTQSDARARQTPLPAAQPDGGAAQQSEAQIKGNQGKQQDADGACAVRGQVQQPSALRRFKEQSQPGGKRHAHCEGEPNQGHQSRHFGGREPCGRVKAQADRSGGEHGHAQVMSHRRGDEGVQRHARIGQRAAHMAQGQHVVPRQGQVAAERAQHRQQQAAGGHPVKGLAYLGEGGIRQFLMQHPQCGQE